MLDLIRSKSISAKLDSGCNRYFHQQPLNLKDLTVAICSCEFKATKVGIPVDRCTRHRVFTTDGWQNQVESELQLIQEELILVESKRSVCLSIRSKYS